MADTAEDICNLALSRVGHKKLIDDLEADATPEARACAAVYSTVRDTLLQMFAWPFATRRATLAEVEEEGDRDEEWEYVYALPADCLQPQYIVSGNSRVAQKKDRIPFRLEAGEVDAVSGEVATTVLLSDVEPADAKLVYTARIEAPNLYPPAFVDALAWMLAEELTLAIQVNPRLLPLIEARKRRALNLAEGLALQSEEPDAEPDSSFVTGRR